ncbi:MAG: metalloregulator ArsR/SmtB family transcription factor [Burkholderiales bacterium]|nr:MAG: metalloregulator ArsR/SmtB family transcription factor [Burkholderiales bacterium]
MSRPSPKKQIFEHLARVGKGLSHAVRLELLEAMGQGERSVDALAKVCGLPIANASHHLLLLKDCGLAVSRKEGLQVFYRLSDPEVALMVAAARRIAERQLAEVERIVRENFASRDALAPVRREQLLKMARRGDAVVIDVRPESEYLAGHIAGAINVPVDSLPRFLKKLPKEQEIVAYCRGPYCLLAIEAVELLRKKGYSARRLEEGFPEWVAQALPIER